MIATARVVVRLLAVALAALALRDLARDPIHVNYVLHSVDLESARAADAHGPAQVIIARDNVETLRSLKRGWRLNLDYYYMYGINARMERDYPTAIAMYDAALKIDKRADTYFERASARYESGDADGAMADYIRAVSFGRYSFYDVPSPIQARLMVLGEEFRKAHTRWKKRK